MIKHKFKTRFFPIIFCLLIQLSHNDNSLQAINPIESKYSAISTAIADVIDVFYVQQDIQFEIRVLGRKTAEIKSIIDGISKRNKGDYLTTITWIEDEDEFFQEDYLHFNQSAIVFFVNVTQITYSRIMNTFPKKLRFFYYCLLGYCELQEFSSQLHLRSFEVVTYLYQFYDVDGVIHVYTTEWFTAGSCNIAKRILINTFNKSTMDWNSQLKNYDQFQNFHGCPIVLSGFTSTSGVTILDNNWISEFYDVFSMIGRLKNFNPYLYNEFNALFYDKSKKYLEINAEFFPIYLTDLKEGRELRHLATTFFEVTLMFLTSPGELYTPYEKLLLPFDDQTWYFLIGTFSAAFAVICIINLMSERIKNIVYGEGVKIPAFNVVGTFFGIGQLKLPRGNFGRIILMTFIFFCLVIRTAYQGVQFDMLTKEMRKKPAQSLQQLYDENYTMWATFGSKEFYVLSIMLDSVNKIIHELTKDIGSLVCNFHSSYKQAYLTDNSFIKMLNNKCYSKLNILPDFRLITPAGIATTYNHYLHEGLEEVLQLTIQSGIPQYNKAKLFQTTHNIESYIPTKTEPERFTIGGLSFGFVVWLVACGISTCVFICELVVYFTSKYLRKSNVAPAENLENELNPVENLQVEQNPVVDPLAENLENAVNPADDLENAMNIVENPDNAVNPVDDLEIELDFENALDIAVLDGIDENLIEANPEIIPEDVENFQQETEMQLSSRTATSSRKSWKNSVLNMIHEKLSNSDAKPEPNADVLENPRDFKQDNRNQAKSRIAGKLHERLRRLRISRECKVNSSSISVVSSFNKNNIELDEEKSLEIANIETEFQSESRIAEKSQDSLRMLRNPTESLDISVLKSINDKSIELDVESNQSEIAKLSTQDQESQLESRIAAKLDENLTRLSNVKECAAIFLKIASTNAVNENNSPHESEIASESPKSSAQETEIPSTSIQGNTSYTFDILASNAINENITESVESISEVPESSNHAKNIQQDSKIARKFQDNLKRLRNAR